MNLTDLQVELRAIEEHIAMLHGEIERMKPQTEEEKKTDFEQITRLAEEHQIVNRSILSAPTEIKKLIFSSMSYILLLEEKDFYNRILYLCRLSKGCGFTVSAEELYRIGLEFEMPDLHKLSNDISDYKYPYLVESFIMANLSEEASVNILSIIADLARFFDVSKEEIRVLGMMAKSVLIDDMDYMLNMPVPSRNMWSGKLRDYIDEGWITEHRTLCDVLCIRKYSKKKSTYHSSFIGSMNSTLQSEVEYTDETPCVIKNRLQAGTIVKKGDVICTYSEKELKKKDNKYKNTTLLTGVLEIQERQNPEYITTEKEITAPCDGVVFFIEDIRSGVVKEHPDKYIAIYVVSYFDYYKEFCKWYNTKFNA